MAYTTPEVAQMTGATPRQLDHWARKKWIDLGPNPGTGNARLWTRRNMLTAQMIVKGIAAGFSVEQAAKIADLVIESVMTRRDPASLQIKLGKGIRVVISTHEALGLGSMPTVEIDTVEREIA